MASGSSIVSQVHTPAHIASAAPNGAIVLIDRARSQRCVTRSPASQSIIAPTQPAIAIPPNGRIMKATTDIAAASHIHNCSCRPSALANARCAATIAVKNGISVMKEKLRNMKQGLQISSPVAASACHRGAPHLIASAWNINPHNTASATTEISSDTELPPNACAQATP